MNISNGNSHCPNKSAGFVSVVDLYGDYVAIYEHFTIRTSLQKILIPIWMVLGVPGSVLCVIIWTRPKLLHTSSIYLAALGVADLGFFICLIIWHLKTVWKIDLISVPFLCEAFAVSYLFLQYLSPLFTFAFSLERYIQICLPFHGEKFISNAKAVRYSLGLTTIAFLLSLVQGYFFQYNAVEKACLERESIVQEGSWQNRFLFYWNLTTESLIFGIVPLTILLLNILVIKETRSLQRKTPKIRNKQLIIDGVCDDQGVSNNCKTKSASTTMMLLSVSFYFILSTLPVTVTQLMIIHSFWVGDECLSAPEVLSDHVWMLHFRMVNVRSVIESLALSHYAAKFFIYISTGKQFRSQFLALFFSRNRRSTPGNTKWNYSTSTDHNTSLISNSRCRRYENNKSNKEKQIKPLTTDSYDL